MPAADAERLMLSERARRLTPSTALYITGNATAGVLYAVFCIVSTSTNSSANDTYIAFLNPIACQGSHQFTLSQ